MKVKRLIINSLFLAIGAVLHQLTPPILFGMKPDFSLVMLFIIMVLNDDYKTCLSAGIIAGRYISCNDNRISRRTISKYSR